MSEATFVLVHGAWHGGWCWRRVADRLRRAGHVVYTPTLTGLADRSHLLSRDVNLATHVADVVNLMRWEDLDRVVLCGHSYGGMVITGVAEAMAARIAAIVYLDAFVPDDGQSLVELRPRPLPEGIAMPPTSAAFFRVNERDQAWVDAKCTPQPIACMTDKLRHTGAYRAIARKIYVRAAGYPSPAFDAAHERCRADPQWTTHALPSGHDVMVDMPDELTGILMKAVEVTP